jgi:hypothetical protein
VLCEVVLVVSMMLVVVNDGEKRRGKPRQTYIVANSVKNREARPLISGALLDRAFSVDRCRRSVYNFFCRAATIRPAAFKRWHSRHPSMTVTLTAFLAPKLSKPEPGRNELTTDRMKKSCPGANILRESTVCLCGSGHDTSRRSRRGRSVPGQHTRVEAYDERGE